MPQYINTNMAALNSQRSLSTSQNALALSLQRLSSGMRINSAKDDAAGMAIASRMTSQISGLGQAVRNANDGISLAQTAEGAMNTITDNLQRMRDLSVQASNASATATDRVSINNEIQQLSAEIQRVSASTNFNGTKLLDGSFNAQTFQVGANQGDTVNIPSIANMQTTQLGAAGTSYVATLTGGVTTQSLVPGSLTLNGTQVGASQAGLAAGQSASSAFSIVSAINAVSGTSGVTATANATNLVGATPVSAAIPANSFSINGVKVGLIAAGGNAAGQGTNVAAAINLISAQTGVTAIADAKTGIVTLSTSDGRNINITANTNSVNGGLTAYQTLLNDTGFGSAAPVSITSQGMATGGAVVVSITVNGYTPPGLVAGLAGPPPSTPVQNAQSFVNAFNAISTVGAGVPFTYTNTAIGGLIASTDTNGVISLTSNGNAASVKTINITAQANAGLATSQVGVTFTGGIANASDTLVSAGPVPIAGATTLSMVVNGATVNYPGAGNSPANNTIQENAAGFVKAFNDAALLDTRIAGITASSDANGVISLSSNGTVAAINISSQANTGLALSQLNVAYTAQHGTISLSSTSSTGIVQAGGAAGSAGFTSATIAPTTLAYVNSISNLNTLSSANAQAAITTIDGALAKVSTARGDLGAFQNRFASAVANMQITSENLAASRSRIQDTDFAAETGALSRAQILQQAGTAMLAQANSSPNGVMALLR